MESERPTTRVLVMDDNLEIRSMLRDAARKAGCDAGTASTLEDGLLLARRRPLDVVFLDVRMPDGSGLDIMRELQHLPHAPEIVVMTGSGDSRSAERAIRSGAWDCIRKPFTFEQIESVLGRVIQYREGRLSMGGPVRELKRNGIIGSGPAIRDCLEVVAKAAQGDTNVLVTGETGTGKELFARAIHANSARASDRFVVVDCTTLSENLVESALFGHEKGAFTGADRHSEGLVALANGGTLFLDEIGEMSLSLQKAFLRVLQERRFRPVGAKTEVESNFRLVAATNRNLSEMVRNGTFREDLLYRLNTISLCLPPLRERKEDLPELVEEIAVGIHARLDLPPKRVSEEFMAALENHLWPGNVRELIHTIEASVSEAYYEGILFPRHLPSRVRVKVVQPRTRPLSPAGVPSRPTDRVGAGTGLASTPLKPFREFREAVVGQAEAAYLRELLSRTRGSVKAACAISALSRSRLYGLMKKHGIDRMGW